MLETQIFHSILRETTNKVLGIKRVAFIITGQKEVYKTHLKTYMLVVVLVPEE